MRLSTKTTFAAFASGITIGATFFSVTASAWTGPTATAPNSNVAPPLNVGSVNQTKNGNIGVNGLAVFGNTLLDGTNGDGTGNGVNSYLNFGGTSGSSGYGIRDNNGTLEFKNNSGSWSSLQSSVYSYVSSITNSSYVTKLIGIYSNSTVTTNSSITFSSAYTAPGAFTGNLVLPATATQIIVQLWGGGGGGSSSPGYGAAGGSSCFGTNSTACTSPILTATAGNGGGGYLATNAGGTGSGGIVNVSGGSGTGSGSATVSAGNYAGSPGGTASFGGAGGGGGEGGNNDAVGGGGGSAYGGGGGGGGAGGTAPGGYGGGAGGYSETLLSSHASTYYYTVGYGGGGGGYSSASGSTGGNGVGNTSPGGGGGSSGAAGTVGTQGAATAGSASGGGRGGGTGGQNTSGGGGGGQGGIIVTVYATSTPNAAGNDYAEMYPVADPSINAGDIVSVSNSAPIHMRLAQAGDTTLAGIVSTVPGQVLGAQNAVNQRPIALSGRVPVKVDLEGGPINIGDRIAISSVAGVGKKAGVFDDSVGIAMESFPSTDSTNPLQAGSGQVTGTITVFLDLQKGTDINDIALGLLGQSAFNDIATPTSSTAASGTPAYATNFLQAILKQVGRWLGSATNGIGDMYANVVHAHKVTADELCAGSVCIDQSQLVMILSGVVGTSSTDSGSAATSAPPAK